MTFKKKIESMGYEIPVYNFRESYNVLTYRAEDIENIIKDIVKDWEFIFTTSRILVYIQSRGQSINLRCIFVFKDKTMRTVSHYVYVGEKATLGKVIQHLVNAILNK